MSTKSIDLLTRARRPRILVIGDVMLDRYLWGEVDRISPEAPIPVLRVGKREDRLGGAGSVATMLAALGAEVSLATVVGDDHPGRTVRRLLGEIGVDTASTLLDRDRETTVKERLLGRTHGKHDQQMMRVDREQSHAVGPEMVERLMGAVLGHVGGIDLILLSDYAKGVCSDDLIRQVVELARATDLPVVADPVRDADYRRYAGCACITPNRTEAGLALGMTIRTPQDGLEAARRLLDRGIEAAMVTLDRDGIAWATRNGDAQHFPIRPRQVHDITGAGDMVLSALGFALAGGADYPTAIELANLAGGLEVERLGVVPISREELLAELSASTETSDPSGKILPIEQLRHALRRHRDRGQRVAMTNGCFDLLHPGHVASLQEARRHGDLLVVGLNSDRSVRACKGPDRPIIEQQGRAEMLAALQCVDYVVLFDEPDVTELVRQVLPDVLVKSAEYATDEVVGHEIVEQHGGRVVLVPMQGSYSTTNLVRAIRETPERAPGRS